jgi:hypothetical protein
MDFIDFVKHSRKFWFWILAGGITCLFVFTLRNILFRQEDGLSAASSPPQMNPSPIATASPGEWPNDDLVQIPAVPSKQRELQEKQLLPPTPPPLDKAAIEMHQTMVAGLNVELRERTRGLYGVAFQQLGLPANLQEKVIDILTQQQHQIEQQAFEAAQSGNFLTPLSPEEMRTQQAQQDDQLRSVLGEAGFAQFNQYQTTIPDRILIDQMNQQGANLSDSQSAKLLQVLTESRQQIFGQSSATSNLSSIPPDQAVAAIQQRQALLQQAVSERVQSILTPDQGKTLQGAISQLTIVPQGR